MADAQVYPAPYIGPSQSAVAAAAAVLKEEIEAKVRQVRESAILCPHCGDVGLVVNWTRRSVYKETSGPYDRDRYFSHPEFVCPHCHRASFLCHEEYTEYPTQMDYGHHMKQETIDE